MAKTCSLVHLVLVVVVLCGSLFPEARSQTCREPLGSCDHCEERCTSRHPGAEARCANWLTLEFCDCSFGCSKTCEEAFDVPNCTNQVCNAQCGAKHGEDWSTGFCEQLVYPFTLCKCQYKC